MVSSPSPSSVPAGNDYSVSKNTDLWGTHVGSFVVAASAVGLRAASRRISRAPCSWDDLFILLALVFSAVWVLITTAYLMPHGLGRHAWTEPPNAGVVIAKGVFFQEIAYSLAILFTKASVLALYWRIFGKDSRIRPWIHLLTFVLVGWAIAGIFLTIFQCQSPRVFWDMEDPQFVGHTYSCPVNEAVSLLINCLIAILTDIALIVLPIPFIWTLQMARIQKLGLIGVFLCSFVATALAVCRMVGLIETAYSNKKDYIWVVSADIDWAVREINSSIVCACLPSLRPVLNIILSCIKKQTSRSSGLATQGGRMATISSRSGTAPSSTNHTKGPTPNRPRIWSSPVREPEKAVVREDWECKVEGNNKSGFELLSQGEFRGGISHSENVQHFLDTSNEHVDNSMIWRHTEINIEEV